MNSKLSSSLHSIFPLFFYGAEELLLVTPFWLVKVSSDQVYLICLLANKFLFSLDQMPKILLKYCILKLLTSRFMTLLFKSFLSSLCLDL